MSKKIKKSFGTPIIGGKYKGKQIEIPSVTTTRSSKSILRESLFNTLQFDIVNQNFVEVFAGSGSIALEAISRGAKRAWCIEKDKSVYNILQSNIDKIAPNMIIAINGDSFELFENIKTQATADSSKAYFYFDPPFSIREGMDNIYENTLKLIESIKPNEAVMVIIEHMSQYDLPSQIGSMQLKKSKRFGKSKLSYYEPVE